jgi:hypothetical protein
MKSKPIMERMARARDRGQPADGLLRSRHNRALPEGGKRWATVTAEAPLGEVRFTLPARHGQQAREVRHQVWAKRIELSDGKRGRVSATCIVAREVDAPVGVKPLEWRLLTHREAATIEAAAELIDGYRARWEMERFFDMLKNACRVEALQLSPMERLERALALFRVVAWRIARLMRLGRTCPDLDAELLFDPDEWKAAFILSKKPVPKTPPRLNEGVRLVAKLGGFLARQGDGEPGAKTLWQGLQRVMDFAAGLKYAREAHVLSCV